MTDERTPQEIVTDFVLEKAASEPLPRRVQLYRAVAAVLPEGAPAQCLVSAADELEAAEARAGQQLLRFRQG
jgi:hypothetical protein